MNKYEEKVIQNDDKISCLLDQLYTLQKEKLNLESAYLETLDIISILKSCFEVEQVKHKRNGIRDSDWQTVLVYRARKISVLRCMQMFLEGKDFKPLNLGEDAATIVLRQMISLVITSSPNPYVWNLFVEPNMFYHLMLKIAKYNSANQDICQMF